MINLKQKLLTNFFLILIITLIIGIVSRKQLINSFYHSVCATPLPYKIGNIDPRFGLNQSQVETDLKQATNVWNQVNGQTLFDEENNSQSLTVNFVYDKRQALNSQIQELQNQLNQQKQSLDPRISDYENKKAAFEKTLADLNAQIESWNQKGGAPPDVYQQLKSQQEALKVQAEELNAEARSLNLSAQDYNSGVSNLNQTIRSFDAALSRKPEEGLYDPQTNTITIYFVNSQPELIHTLAHELGHYLWLNHNQNDRSIMYPYTNEITTPSSDDKAELNQICSQKRITIPWINFKSKTF